MWFWAKDPEPQNQSTSLTGLNTERVLPPDEMNTAPFSHSFPLGFIMGIMHEGVSENGSATLSSMGIKEKGQWCVITHSVCFRINHFLSSKLSCCRLFLARTESVLVRGGGGGGGE